MFLERATELNLPTRSHRSIDKFQVTHVGYGVTWKEKSIMIVKAFSMKIQNSHPNHTMPCATSRLKSFASLIIILHWYEQRKTFDVDILYAVPKYRTDEGTCKYRSAHPRKYLRASTRPPQPSTEFHSKVFTTWKKYRWWTFPQWPCRSFARYYFGTFPSHTKIIDRKLECLSNHHAAIHDCWTPSSPRSISYLISSRVSLSWLPMPFSFKWKLF